MLSSPNAVSVPASHREKRPNFLVIVGAIVVVLFILGAVEKLSQTPMDQPNLLLPRPDTWAPGQGHNTAPESRLALITPEEEALIQFDYCFLVSNPTFEWESYLQARSGDIIYDRRDREFFRNVSNEFVDVVVYSSQPPPTQAFLDSLGGR